MRVTKAFLPLLRESQGRVVVIASMAGILSLYCFQSLISIFKIKYFGVGRVTLAGFTPYSMSKFAAIAFADGLRREMKKWSISVHLIEPTLYK